MKEPFAVCSDHEVSRLYICRSSSMLIIEIFAIKKSSAIHYFNIIVAASKNDKLLSIISTSMVVDLCSHYTTRGSLSHRWTPQTSHHSFCMHSAGPSPEKNVNWVLKDSYLQNWRVNYILYTNMIKSF